MGELVQSDLVCDAFSKDCITTEPGRGAPLSRSAKAPAGSGAIRSSLMRRTSRRLGAEAMSRFRKGIVSADSVPSGMISGLLA